MHLWYFFLGNLSLGFKELCGIGELTCCQVRPCFQQQQNDKGNVCFESVLVTVGSHFSVLRSQVFCRILGWDFDNGFQVLNSDRQAWRQVPLSLFTSPTLEVFFSYISSLYHVFFISSYRMIKI